MSVASNNFVRERCRLVFEANEILHELDKCISNVKNGFAEINEYYEAKKTIGRLNGEVKVLHAELAEKLNSKG